MQVSADPARLQALSEEIGRIADGLAEMREPRHPAPVTAARVRAILRARRFRDSCFPGLFADPAWDMMLDLLAARLEGRQVQVSSLRIAAAVPSTTAMRWINALSARGLFVRSRDACDKRRVYVALSDDTAEAMMHCLARAQAISSSPI